MAKHTQQKGNKDVLLYGNHPVTAALNNKKRKILELYCTKDSLISQKSAVSKRIVTRDFLDNLVGRDAVHQGVVVRCAPLEPVTLSDFLKSIKGQDTAAVLILDQVTDPHNIGAIMRSAVAFDVGAVIIPEAGAPDETGVLAKSASGALEMIPLIKVPNLVRAMAKLKENDFWCIGMDGYADKVIFEQKLPMKSAFVMGSEGSGMRRLTQDNCDFVTKLPINPRIESLNVSNAAVLTLYEFRRQHPTL